MRIPGVGSHVRAIVIATLAALAACGGSTTSAPTGSGTGPTTGTQDPGVTAPGATPGGAIAGHDANPDGVAYPTANVGYTPRKNTTPGNIINNYKFLGYPDSDPSKGLQPVALADYFDPNGKTTKILHISVSGVWCEYCKLETSALVPLIPQLKAEKVIYLTALSENVDHKPASQSDLDFWIKTYKTNYTHVLDPGNAMLGPFFDAAAIPWNANIDASTMEILSAGVGAPTDSQGNIDIISDVQPWIDWYAKNHPNNK